MYLQNGKEQHTCVILAKSSTGRAHGLSGSLRRFRPGLSRSRSQGWEWHLGSWGGRARRTEDGVLQADEGEAGTAGGWDGICGGTGGGGKNWAAASRMSTGEREKRLCGGGGGWSGEGEEEHEDGEGKKQQQAPPPAPSLGSQGNIHGSGESGERARLKKVGLEEECSEELSEELGHAWTWPPRPLHCGIGGSLVSRPWRRSAAKCTGSVKGPLVQTANDSGVWGVAGGEVEAREKTGPSQRC